MDAKEFLMQSIKIKKEIEKNETVIQNLKSVATKTNTMPEGERVQGSRNLDPMGQAVIDWIDLEEENRNLLEKLMIKQKEVIDVIRQIGSIEIIDIMIKRYILDMRFADIARIKDRSERSIFDCHKKGLEEVEKILKLQ